MTKHSGFRHLGQPLKPSNNTVRIATSLGSACDLEASSAAGAGSLSAGMVEAIIQERELRANYVPGELLTEPAWDMLLELLHAELVERDVTAAVLCKAARVSLSVGLRWIEVLVSKGLCTCTNLITNPDRTVVELSERGSEAMRGYLAEVARSE